MEVWDVLQKFFISYLSQEIKHANFFHFPIKEYKKPSLNVSQMRKL